jgi:hypothetical protein
MESTQANNENNPRDPRSGGASVPWTPAEVAAGATPAHGISTCVPFVVQSGRMILMVEATDDGWTLAELDFQPRECVFRESRRVTYTWPREAFGSLLSRLAGADLVRRIRC